MESPQDLTVLEHIWSLHSRHEDVALLPAKTFKSPFRSLQYVPGGQRFKVTKSS